MVFDQRQAYTTTPLLILVNLRPVFLIWKSRSDLIQIESRKTTWAKFSASPATSTNQILIEDVLQEVIKVIKSIKPTSGKISIKTTTKNSGGKHAYVQGVG